MLLFFFLSLRRGKNIRKYFSWFVCDRSESWKLELQKVFTSYLFEFGPVVKCLEELGVLRKSFLIDLSRCSPIIFQGALNKKTLKFLLYCWMKKRLIVHSKICRNNHKMSHLICAKTFIFGQRQKIFHYFSIFDVL